ncbi:type II toxin-antitoxin system RelE/ParE family toxin [Rhizobium sp. XQZ8]|uniref:type II toxin-antitoxin system RelE/ParE family toxin n=1 Tax=Rhizobium populisoli TaxID=2859785 RepID=UPI001C6712E1|nr:type II toxin-antitoxin system RelE/ParE family toxin [Rhizobium populisoli]MBW6421559.1 type II toxin-antitoxin system RelE/ParE family toxin [Rhizobium populisoli]
MPRLIWTPAALRDVQRLYRFLSPKNPDSAKRAIHAIRTGVKILAEQPHIGRHAENMEEGYREWLVKFGDSGYIVLYRVDAETISLLAIRHQKEAGY